MVARTAYCGEPSSCPLRLRAVFRFDGKAGRGDLDNYFKAVADALQGVLYENDKQIIEAHVYKVRAPGKGAPETEVTLWRGLGGSWQAPGQA